MESFIPHWVLDVSMCILSVSALMCLYCIVRGPTLADRILSSDAFCVCVIGAISLYSLKAGNLYDLSAVLVLAIVGFIGVIVVAKYIGGGGDAIDRD
jgi:multisubunit Na+/H+ antiporter MnhF subunit